MYLLFQLTFPSPTQSASKNNYLRRLKLLCGRLMDGQKNDSELILLSLCQPAYAADTEATEAQFMNDHPEYSGFLLVSYIYHILYIWSKMFIVL